MSHGRKYQHCTTLTPTAEMNVQPRANTAEDFIIYAGISSAVHISWRYVAFRRHTFLAITECIARFIFHMMV